MTDIRRQWLFWLGFGVVALLLLWLLRGMLLPFILGLAIAFFLDPAADFLERRGLSRLWATSLIVFVFFLVVTLLALLIVPRVVDQAIELMRQLPALYQRLRDLAEPLIQRAMDATGSGGDSSNMIGSVLEKAASITANLVGALVGGGIILFDVVSLLLITPIVTFYMLRDWDRIIRSVDSWLPRRYAPTIREQAADIQRVLAGFVRGQAMVCLALAVFYAVGLSVVGLKYGLIIALLSGLLSFIPFVGTVFGFVASVGVAIAQFWPDYWMVAVVAGIYVAGQMIEGNILSPWLVGNQVNLHPVWMIFGLMAGGALFGFVGVLLAVPVFAAIGVLTRFGLRRYMASPLYGGDASPPSSPA
jgi:predicted PurR-regulated permease PerM